MTLLELKGINSPMVTPLTADGGLDEKGLEKTDRASKLLVV